MLRTARLVLCLAGLAAAGSPAFAQDFQPPESRPAASGGGGVRVDLLGFSTRAGADVSHSAFVLGSTIDIAQLGSPQVRLRPSFEYSGSGTSTALHVATEVIYRFQPDNAPVIPYAGMGAGYYTSSAEHLRRVWLNVVMGFEMEFRPSFNWLLEYHALDRLGRHRFLIGLATRGGQP